MKSKLATADLMVEIQGFSDVTAVGQDADDAFCRRAARTLLRRCVFLPAFLRQLSWHGEPMIGQYLMAMALLLQAAGIAWASMLTRMKGS